jgi:ArsR family transcriptional regulator, arsenate/arsenite/antimonite-responsive transcriptional repressor
VRIRVLELLCEGPKPVRDLLADSEIQSVAVSASNLSQQLAVLRRYGIVTTAREGASVLYALAGSDVSDLMMAAHRILTEMLADRHDLLIQLREPHTG